jgi:hypothetical protein
MQNVTGNIYILDVEGALCANETLINPDFKSWLMKWAKTGTVYLSTDNSFTQTLHLLGSYLCLSINEIHHSCGNAVWAGGVEKSRSRWQVPAKAKAWLEFELRKSEFQTHAVDKMEDRPGMVYASVIGVKPLEKEKAEYLKWDKQYSERAQIINSFNVNFPELTAHYSGDTGVCITDSGKNKGQIIEKVSSPGRNIVYFGYKIGPDSCDKDIVDGLRETDKWYSVNDWQETWKTLKTQYNA